MTCEECKQPMEPRAHPNSATATMPGKKFCSSACRARGQYNPKRHRAKYLLRKYGMSLEDFDVRLASQGGRCSCCGTDRPTGKGWAVDHDHETGAVRGIVCLDCNSMLGYARDNPRNLAAGIEYLRRNGKSEDSNLGAGES